MPTPMMLPTMSAVATVSPNPRSSGVVAAGASPPPVTFGLYALSDAMAAMTLDHLSVNAGAALYASDVAASLAEGVDMAREALSSGRAGEALFNFVQTTQGLAAPQQA